jgi:hypothetical protein
LTLDKGDRLSEMSKHSLSILPSSPLDFATQAR